MSVATKAKNLNAFGSGSFVSKGDTLPYRILFPKNFEPAEKYPLLLFLHGRGESGKDNRAQLKIGGAFFSHKNFREKYPSIVIFPQCAWESYWSNVDIKPEGSDKRSFHFKNAGKPTNSMAPLLTFMDNFVAKPFVDKHRVYVGGLSMGGMGTLEILRRRTKMFAAGFPICGGDNVANVKKYNKVPLWIFHGADDDVVPAFLSQNVADALKAKGAKDVKLSVYPGVKHNSWDNAFAEPELLSWLFSKSR